MSSLYKEKSDLNANGGFLAFLLQIHGVDLVEKIFDQSVIKVLNREYSQKYPIMELEETVN